MQSVGHYIKRVSELPLQETARLVWALVNAKVMGKALQFRDKHLPTNRCYTVSRHGLNPIKINGVSLDFSGLDVQIAKELWRMYKTHRFDLLGSGWGNVGYHNNQPGFEGSKYEYRIPSIMKGSASFLEDVLLKKDVAYAQRVWALISDDYEPIDWQRDFKSGYRWSAKDWYKPTILADKPGGDIKIPWELSRLQHLPRLVILYKLLPQEQNRILSEYRNQILDFIAQNPIRMGVNFMCPMDVGIRNANIALSYSLFRGLGEEFDQEFERIVSDYLIDSTKYIYDNLELSSVYRSNHYFADIAGILFGASILPNCKEKKKFLAFARNEIVKEIGCQFYEEGTNREGSVAYHRLTTEIALYSLALIHYLAKQNEVEDADNAVYAKIARACIFLDDITRPDGCFPSMGDNDGGVFFRFSFTGGLIQPKDAIQKYWNLTSYHIAEDDEWYYDENLCDGRTLVSAGAGMFAGRFWENDVYRFEKSMVKAIYGKAGRDGSESQEKNVVEITGTSEEKLSYSNTKVVETGCKLNLEELQTIHYDSFGVVIYKSPKLFLCINLMDNGQNGIAGHAHNDKLSIELMIDGKNIFEDPGTYVYTADVRLRDQFRSVHAHNTIIVEDNEQNEFDGTFSMKNETKCKVICLTKDRFVGEVSYRDVCHTREIQIYEDRIVIIDKCNKSFLENWGNGLHTRGYGKKLREI